MIDSFVETVTVLTHVVTDSLVLDDEKASDQTVSVRPILRLLIRMLSQNKLLKIHICDRKSSSVCSPSRLGPQNLAPASRLWPLRLSRIDWPSTHFCPVCFNSFTTLNFLRHPTLFTPNSPSAA
eukprot:GABV01003465.1.p1 GENE.GABV01003465.1~~GABV01003465.1.p1  ORF type:complete len:124 (+),score=26.88 GABV01003465.1:1-372(+)